jgi:hypothetical protein
MSHIAKNYYPERSGAAATRGAVLALGAALVIATGTVAAAIAPAGDTDPAPRPHQAAQLEQELSR